MRFAFDSAYFLDYSSALTPVSGIFRGKCSDAALTRPALIRNTSSVQQAARVPFQRCVFNNAANRAAPEREAVISLPTRSRSPTR